MKTVAAAKQTTEKTENCSRCEGKGHIAFYGHVLGGICFKCSGSGQQKVSRRRSTKRIPEEQLKQSRANSQRAYDLLEKLYGDRPAVQQEKRSGRPQRAVEEVLTLQYQRETGNLWKTRPADNLEVLEGLAS